MVAQGQMISARTVLFIVCTHASLAPAHDQMRDCVLKASTIRVGMTRAKIEALVAHDGGIMGIFKGERFFFTGLKQGEQPTKEYWKRKFCMVNIDFHPQGLPDATFDDVNRFAQWVKANSWHPDPKDIAVKISAPFIDSYHFD
jgi:hypothetical protein